MLEEKSKRRTWNIWTNHAHFLLFVLDSQLAVIPRSWLNTCASLQRQWCVNISPLKVASLRILCLGIMPLVILLLWLNVAPGKHCHIYGVSVPKHSGFSTSKAFEFWFQLDAGSVRVFLICLLSFNCQTSGYLITSHGAEVEVERSCFYDTDSTNMSPILLIEQHGIPSLKIATTTLLTVSGLVVQLVKVWQMQLVKNWRQVPQCASERMRNV